MELNTELPVTSGSSEITGLELTARVDADDFVAAPILFRIVCTTASLFPAIDCVRNIMELVCPAMEAQVPEMSVVPAETAAGHSHHWIVRVGVSKPLKSVVSVAVNVSPTCALPAMVGLWAPKVGRSRMRPEVFVKLTAELAPSLFDRTVVVTRAKIHLPAIMEFWTRVWAVSLGMTAQSDG